MSKKLLLIILCSMMVAGCATHQYTISVKDYIGKDATCQNLRGKVTEQSGQYIYIEGTGTSYEENSETYAYKGRQHVSECFFEPQTKEEELQDAQMWYDGIFQDDKRFACRQHVSMPITLIQRGQCDKFKKSEEPGYAYECDIKTSEFSSYPVFCI